MEKIVVIDDFLTQEECYMYMEFIDREKSGNVQKVYKNVALVRTFIAKHSEKLESILLDGVKIKDFHDDVTLSKGMIPLKKHVDSKLHSDKWKLLIYLNNVENGGTVFYDGNEEIIIENKAGKAVFFDISLPHASQVYKKQIKYSIGFRIIT